MNINEKKAAAFLHMPTPPPYFLPQLTPATPPPPSRIFVFFTSSGTPLTIFCHQEPPSRIFYLKYPPRIFVFFTSSGTPPPTYIFLPSRTQHPPPVILSSLPLRVPPPPYIFAIKNPPYFFLEVSPPSSLGGGGSQIKWNSPMDMSK